MASCSKLPLVAEQLEKVTQHKDLGVEVTALIFIISST